MSFCCHFARSGIVFFSPTILTPGLATCDGRQRRLCQCRRACLAGVCWVGRGRRDLGVRRDEERPGPGSASSSQPRPSDFPKVAQSSTTTTPFHPPATTARPLHPSLPPYTTPHRAPLDWTPRAGHGRAALTPASSLCRARRSSASPRRPRLDPRLPPPPRRPPAHHVLPVQEQDEGAAADWAAARDTRYPLQRRPAVADTHPQWHAHPDPVVACRAQRQRQPEFDQRDGAAGAGETQ